MYTIFSFTDYLRWDRNAPQFCLFQLLSGYPILIRALLLEAHVPRRAWTPPRTPMRPNANGTGEVYVRGDARSCISTVQLTNDI